MSVGQGDFARDLDGNPSAIDPHTPTQTEVSAAREAANDLVGCAFCGKAEIRRSDPDWALKAGEHVAHCPRHPLHAALTRLMTLEAENARLRRALRKIAEGFPEHEDSSADAIHAAMRLATSACAGGAA